MAGYTFEKDHMMARRGLSESLEEYARRCDKTVNEARAAWRHQGLRALAAKPTTESGPLLEAVTKSAWRIAPGVAVPTKPVKPVDLEGRE